MRILKLLLFSLVVNVLASKSQAAPSCYRAVGPATQIVGGTQEFVATLLIQDTISIADLLTITSGSKTASMDLWCRDMETRRCQVEAEDRSLVVKQTGDEIQFLFPGKLRIKSGAELGFSAAGKLADRKLTLKKTDLKNCPPGPTAAPEGEKPADAQKGRE